MQYFAGRKNPPAMLSVIAGFDPAIHLFAKEGCADHVRA